MLNVRTTEFQKKETSSLKNGDTRKILRPEETRSFIVPRMGKRAYRQEK